jgi:NodT family efflux transporter outer membrane factor (OMF) lipoprotein
MNQVVSLSNTKRKKRAPAIALACSVLLVLPSCIPSLRKAAPAPPVPQDFNGLNSPENSSQLRIEEFYTDPMLIRLIDQALVGNQELRILNENLRITSNEIQARIGAYLPFLTAGGGASLNKVSSFTLEGAAIRDDEFRPGMFFPNPYGNFLLGFNLFWQIDVWRQLRNARDAAVQRYFSAAEARNALVTRLVSDIAENYYGLMALDARLQNLNRIIELQERSLEIAQARKDAGRSTDLPVQRFLAAVRKNQSEKLIVNQDIILAENRINFLAGRFPQIVERTPVNFIDLRLHALSLGVPSQLLQNRPDIRQAERELAAAGLDVKVARARFFPVVTLTGGVGYQAFNMRYLFLTPEALIGNIAGGLVGPVINFKAIKADYLTANASQLQAVYNYQRVIIEAFTQVINRVSTVENYARSIEIKKLQVEALEAAVAAATSLYQLPRAELPVDYLDVLTAQNELFEAIRDLIATKGEQLSAIVNTYQALGGGNYLLPVPHPASLWPPHEKHLKHSHASVPVVRDPVPPPTPAAAEGGPVPPPTPAAAEGDPVPPPPPPAEGGPVPPPPPAEGPQKPPSTPPAGTSLEPLPPAAERGPEPLPIPPILPVDYWGSGTESGTVAGSIFSPARPSPIRFQNP